MGGAMTEFDRGLKAGLNQAAAILEEYQETVRNKEEPFRYLSKRRIKGDLTNSAFIEYLRKLAA